MFDRVGEIFSMVLGALAVGYLLFEIDRRRRKLHEIFDVLDADDARGHGRERRASALYRGDAGLTAGAAASSAKAGPGTLAVTEDRVFAGGEAIARRFCTARPAVWRDPFIVDRSCPSDCDIELPAGG